MNKQICLATNNKGKLREYREILAPMGFVIYCPADLNLDFDVEENGTDYRENSYLKAKALAAIVLATIYFSMAWIGNSEKHGVIARSVARMSFRIHDVPEFHFYAIADGASDILKRGRIWRGFDPEEAEKRDEASLFAFFGMNTG